MTESQFIEQNKQKWAELELLLQQPKKDADRLQELFVKVSSDLSYARTFYPKRSVRLYLNNLTQNVFDTMGKKKSGFSFKSIIDFFGHSLPEEAYRQRKKIILSFIIFTVSMLIGALSSAKNPEFAKVILGESYVRITDENINKGDPMAIYKDEDATGMFQFITANNLKVAFYCFVLGLLGGIGTTYILVYNGIMVGVFQYYFYSKGLFLTSFLTIWIHGTIEISSIIIAGAAGLILGSGLLFPGTYKRSTALQISAKRSLILLMGTVPLFILAGLLESFVTRLTGLPMIVKISIIALSLFLILLMFAIYPYYYNRNVATVDPNPKVHLQNDENIVYDRYMLRTVSENISLSFAQFRSFFGINVSKVLFPGLALSSIVFYFIIATDTTSGSSSLHWAGNLPFNFGNDYFITPILIAFLLSISICYMELFMKNNLKHVEGILPLLKKHFLFVFLVMLLLTLATFQFGSWMLVVILFIPIQSLMALFDIRFGDNAYDTNNFSHNINVAYANYFPSLVALFISGTFFLVFSLILKSDPVGILEQILSWHHLFDSYYQSAKFILAFSSMTIILMLIPLVYFLFNNFYYSEKCKKESIDLQSRLGSFGQEQNVFE